MRTLVGFTVMQFKLWEGSIDLIICLLIQSHYLPQNSWSKGIGALVVKDPSKLPGFILGGMQENSMRAGTESIANIVGFASAAQKI